MREEFDVNCLPRVPGRKRSGFFRPGGTNGIPATVIDGSAEGKTVLITSGVHGGEYLGVAAAMSIAGSVTADELRGRLIIMHPVNVAAFLAKTQYVNPSDGKNINGCFPGDPEGSESERIAAFLSAMIKLHADFFIDMHCGDIHERIIPFAAYSDIDPKAAASARLAAEASGIGRVCALGHENISIGCAARNGVPALMTEYGGSGTWSAGESDEYCRYIRAVLSHLGLLEAHAPKTLSITGYTSVKAGHTGCWYPAVKTGARLSAGAKVGEIRDFFGETLSEYHCASDCVIIYLVTSFGVNTGESLFAYGLQEKGLIISGKL